MSSTNVLVSQPKSASLKMKVFVLYFYNNTRAKPDTFTFGKYQNQGSEPQDEAVFLYLAKSPFAPLSPPLLD